jgi:hypothetical protein
MAGQCLVREWDPATGATRTWLETLDHAGRVRIVRPETGGPKIHSRFDSVRSGDMMREEASDWARTMREAHDRRELHIVPASHWKAIWRALEFLQMYHGRISPTECMYADEDLIASRP